MSSSPKYVYAAEVLKNRKGVCSGAGTFRNVLCGLRIGAAEVNRSLVTSVGGFLLHCCDWEAK